MKTTLVSIILLFLATGALSQSFPADYVKLSPASYQNNRLIKDLQQLGAEYTLEKGIFQQKPTLPNGSWSIYKTESIYKRIANGVTYYRYTSQLLCESDPYLIRATYTVAFRNANGNTIVTQYSYSILDKNPDTPVLADAPIFINNLLLVKGSDLQKFLDIGLIYTVTDAMSKGLIKKSASYSFVRLFSIQDTGFSIAPGYNYLIQIASKEGYNYRARIIVWDNSGLEPQDALQPEYTIYPNS